VNRRSFLASATAAALLGGTRAARAAPATGGDLRFLFVFNRGGWDPTRVFAPTFDLSGVDMEADAEPATAGGIRYVDHWTRPSVGAFFGAHHARTLVCNGVQVRSIAHDICTMIAMTGSTSGLSSDWPALLASGWRDRATLPHLVLGGPSFPGTEVVSVARAGQSGQLTHLLSGEILDWSDQAVTGPSGPIEGVVDRYLRQRAAGRVGAAASGVDANLAAAWSDSLDRALALKDYRYVMDFGAGGSLEDQALVAVEALSLGLSRCVTLGHPGDAGGGLGWDSHADNDDTQAGLFEELFGGLNVLMALLEGTPGSAAPTLADETVVVVLSEMGRTAQLNATNGKDHWPYTSVMLVGPGITGDRVIGDLDEGYAGLAVDPSSAELDPGGNILSIESIGAALLAMADIDPAEHVAGADPLMGMLS
jgi:hypothetical protein